MYKQSIYSMYGIRTLQEAVDLREKLRESIVMARTSFFGIVAEPAASDLAITEQYIRELNQMISNWVDEKKTPIGKRLDKRQRIKMRKRLLRRRAMVTPHLVLHTDNGLKPVYNHESRVKKLVKTASNRRVRRYDVPGNGNGYRKVYSVTTSRFAA